MDLDLISVSRSLVEEAWNNPDKWNANEKAMSAFRRADGLQASPLSWAAYFDAQAH